MVPLPPQTLRSAIMDLKLPFLMFNVFSRSVFPGFLLVQRYQFRDPALWAHHPGQTERIPRTIVGRDCDRLPGFAIVETDVGPVGANRDPCLFACAPCH